MNSSKTEMLRRGFIVLLLAVGGLGGLALRQVDVLAHAGPTRVVDGREELGLQEHLLEPEPLKRIFLNHLDDRGREERADVPEPLRHRRRRARMQLRRTTPTVWRSVRCARSPTSSLRSATRSRPAAVIS